MSPAAAPAEGPALIGLTGGIAAGKSEVLRLLSESGAEVLSTDAVVHELLASDEVGEVLLEHWGELVSDDSGALDRSLIAEIVFEDPGELKWLESVLHPRVGARVAEWRSDLPAGLEVGVVEVPLLFEGKMAAIFDATIAVVADDGIRERRAAERGTGQLEGRSGRQLTQEEKADRATFVIRNDGHIDDLEAQVRSLYPRLVALRG